MAIYKNGRTAAVGDRVVGVIGANVAAGILASIAPRDNNQVAVVTFEQRYAGGPYDRVPVACNENLFEPVVLEADAEALLHAEDLGLVADTEDELEKAEDALKAAEERVKILEAAAAEAAAKLEVLTAQVNRPVLNLEQPPVETAPVPIPEPVVTTASTQPSLDV